MSDTGTHHYHAVCDWTGSTGAGYEQYTRDHSLQARPAPVTIAASSDPAFRGDPARLNPEQLLVMAAASCQMLSFLAIAARKRVDVVAYHDEAEGVMPDADKPVRITRIVLKPRIVIAGAMVREKVDAMIELAHQHCFIANSLKSGITIEARIEFRA
ncbi:MAG TPA: OsmC family protein [Gammaproteobacteria bacterium]|nr:OsmC family protein [Gammaproteobacteria bacterium]